MIDVAKTVLSRSYAVFFRDGTAQSRLSFLNRFQSFRIGAALFDPPINVRYPPTNASANLH
jgi:hypothetical protein